jgi:hypothetical protein
MDRGRRARERHRGDLARRAIRVFAYGALSHRRPAERMRSAALR